MARGLGFAGAVLVIMVSEQAILNSGVLIVKLKTDDDDLTALVFAVLMIARAPLQLFQAVSTTLLPHLTRLIVREQEGLDAGDFGRSVRMTVIACLVFGGLTVIGVLAVGPQAMRLLFGDEFDYDRLGLVSWRPAWACTWPRRRSTRRCWPGPRAARCLVLGGFGDLLRRLPADRRHGRRCARSRSPSSPRRWCCRACSTSSTARRARATDERVRPGSTEELEVRLAAADEGSLGVEAYVDAGVEPETSSPGCRGSRRARSGAPRRRARSSGARRPRRRRAPCAARRAGRRRSPARRPRASLRSARSRPSSPR